MRPFTLLWKIALPLCALAVILPVPLLCQDIPERMLRAFANRPAEVTIQVRSHPGGDVKFLVFQTGPRRQFDFPEIARRLLGCDWQSEGDFEQLAGGTCRHLLKTRDGVVADNLTRSEEHTSELQSLRH